MKQNPIGVLIRVFVSFGAIALVIYFMRDKLAEAGHILASDVNWGWFVTAVVGYFIANCILAKRLQLVLRVQQVLLGYFETLHLIFLGLFFNLFFPSAVGGDIAKVYYASKHSGNKVAATSSVVFDRLIGFVSLITMALLGILAFSKEFDDPRIHYLVYVFLTLMLVSVIFFTNKNFAKKFRLFFEMIPSEKIRELVHGIYHAMHGYQHHKIALLCLLLLSIAAQVFFILTHYWTVLGLDVHIPLMVFFIIVPVISIVSMAPSLGGLGVREAGAIFIFSRYMSGEKALALALLLDIIIYGHSFLSGLVFSLKGGLKAKVIHEMEEISV